MENKSNEAIADNEVLITHLFNVPQELVFKAWADPNELIKWFAPDGCTIYYKEIDIREGGSFHSCISNPEFGDCWCKGIYTEVLFPERIAFSMIVSDKDGNTVEPVDAGMDANWPKETKTVITFEDLDGKTKLTLYQTVSQSLAQKTGAYPSWLQMLNRLEGQLNYL